MNNRLRLLSVAALILGLFTTSCDTNDFFEEAQGQSSLSGGNWKSNEELDNLVRGGYYLFCANAKSGNISQELYKCILMSDEAHMYPVLASFEERSFYSLNTNNTLGLVEGIWKGPYTVLAVANSAIDAIEATDEKGFDDADRDQVPRIHGEALFLRAMQHFKLIRNFAPAYNRNGSNESTAQIILKTSSTGGGSLANVEETYASVIADVEKAIPLLPRKYDASIHPVSYEYRANKFAAHFLAMRVYFQMGNWEKARQHADSVLSGDNPNNYETLGTFPTTEFIQVDRDKCAQNSGLVFSHYQNYGRLLNDLMTLATGGANHYAWWMWPERRVAMPTNRDKRFALSNHFLNITGWDKYVNQLASTPEGTRVFTTDDKRFGTYYNETFNLFAVNLTRYDRTTEDDPSGVMPGLKTRFTTNGYFQYYNNASSNIYDHDPVLYVDNDDDGVVDVPNPHQANFSPGWLANGYRPAALWVKKYQENTKQYNYCRFRQVPHHPLFRLKEAYLTRAFCKRVANDADWQNDLDMVRVGMDKVGGAAQGKGVRNPAYDDINMAPYANKGYSDFEIIEVERMIEMAMEYDRVYYLQATRQTGSGATYSQFEQGKIPTGDRALPTSEGGLNQAASRDIFDNAYVLPVPLSERQTNPLFP